MSSAQCPWCHSTGYVSADGCSKCSFKEVSSKISVLSDNEVIARLKEGKDVYAFSFGDDPDHEIQGRFSSIADAADAIRAVRDAWGWKGPIHYHKTALVTSEDILAVPDAIELIKDFIEQQYALPDLTIDEAALKEFIKKGLLLDGTNTETYVFDGEPFMTHQTPT